MRAVTEQRVVAAEPGAIASVVVDVVNNGEVIDGISASIIGLPEQFVTAEPSVLPLFPAAGGRLTLSVAVPPTYPAGRHPLSVELTSHGANTPPHYLDVDLDVAPHPSMALGASPRVVHARRSARFVLEVRNDGNVPVDVALQAADVDRASKATFAPQQLRVEPGSAAPVLLHVRGPRMVTGADIDRPVQIVATATRADLAPDAAPEPGVAPIPPRELSVRLRQRPLVSRGMLTALVLVGIVGLWAAVFLLGLTKVFSNDPMTKAAPASFFVADQGSAATGTGGSGAQGAAGDAGAAVAPAGALPKSGQLPPGIGGQITGVVVSASTEQPVGQILVEAYRAGGKDTEPVSSAATQTDGTYTLAGLFPTSYYLKFSASGGFVPVWYPNAPTKAGAHVVDAAAQGTTSGVNATIRGLPASISGAVDPGDTLRSVQTTVTARPLNVAGGNAMSRSVTTDSAGKYSFAGLAAPASYQLTFRTDGYQTSTLTDTVNGGDKRLEATITLGAAQGGISGIVVSGTAAGAQPIGGATVTTTVGGRTVTVLTPTAGAVGTFAIPNLPTPATYVLNFSAPGHGTWTQVVDLRAGESNTKVIGRLSNGSGTITGMVYDGNSPAGLGGVTVTVGGAASTGATGDGLAATATPTTTTLTGGSVGSFYLNGLANGPYTLTFSLDRYTSASVPVTVSSDGHTPPVRIRLYRQLGEILGVVHVNGVATPGATVSATDGTTTYTATSSAAGGVLTTGGYDLAALPPGTYSVTATMPNARQQTRIVRVGRDQRVTGKDFYLTPAAG